MQAAEDTSDFAERRDVLDRAHLAAQTGNDLVLQRDLLDLFILQSAELAAEMDRTGRAEPVAAAEIAHRLSGSARAIGAFALAGVATELERALANERGPASFDPLIVALTETLDAVEAYLRTPAFRGH